MDFLDHISPSYSYLWQHTQHGAIFCLHVSWLWSVLHTTESHRHRTSLIWNVGGKKITATSHNTMKCGNFFWGIGWATWILTRILLSLCVRMQRVLRSEDNRCPFMHGRPDSHTLASYPLAAQGNSAPASSQTLDQKFDWNWNEEIQEHVIWLRGWSAVSTQSHRRSAIRNIRYACIAGGYSMGLETGIISRWLDCENRPRWV